MNEQEPLPREFLERLKLVKGKRARIVVEHILKHGFITTEELEKTYGYSHPPRAIRDVREQGIPLQTVRVKSSDGRTIAAYRFGNVAQVRIDRSGRRNFPKNFKKLLYSQSNGRCGICNGTFEARYLQIDHRVPFEIAGNIEHFERDTADYMLLCSNCNRAKSWSCEHCPNWNIRSEKICAQCYWAYPLEYTHIALREIRRTDIVWNGDELSVYEALRKAALSAEIPVPDYIKTIIRNRFGSEQLED